MKYFFLVPVFLILFGFLYFSRNFDPVVIDARPVDITQTNINLNTSGEGYQCLSETQIKDFYVPTGERFTVHDNEVCNLMK